MAYCVQLSHMSILAQATKLYACKYYHITYFLFVYFVGGLIFMFFSVNQHLQKLNPQKILQLVLEPTCTCCLRFITEDSFSHSAHPYCTTFDQCLNRAWACMFQPTDICTCMYICSYIHIHMHKAESNFRGTSCFTKIKPANTCSSCNTRTMVFMKILPRKKSLYSMCCFMNSRTLDRQQSDHVLNALCNQRKHKGLA